jgi:hypothetical protein
MKFAATRGQAVFTNRNMVTSSMEAPSATSGHMQQQSTFVTHSIDTSWARVSERGACLEFVVSSGNPSGEVR